MTLFTGLMDQSGSGKVDEEGGVYLGSKSLRLREQKMHLVNELVGPDYKIIRPKLEGINISSEDSIFRFIAQENLECEFFCGPERGIEHIKMLCKIIQGILEEGEHIHIGVHPHYPQAQGKIANEDLLAYFQVRIKDVAQLEQERNGLLDSFRSLILSIIPGSSNQ